jgi:5'-nucleotidase
VAERRILLSNDDGIDAPGLAALRAVVEDLGSVQVVAPASPQSAAGHAITLSQALTIRRVPLCGGRHEGLSVDGRPADCVRLAIRKLLDRRVDLVIAGINAGSNVGVNVFYSGTVAAAAEAAMLGIPAVAISAVVPDGAGMDDFLPVARLARWVLDRLLDAGLVAGDLINVNIPPLTAGQPGCGAEGIVFVPQSTAEIEDVYHPETVPGGHDAFRLGDTYRFTPAQENTDVVRLAEGYVTVTPLHVDMTNHDRLAALTGLHWPAPPRP